MLSERPNVRVHNDPLRMCPVRESSSGGRETPGAALSRAFQARPLRSLVRFFVPHKEMNIKK
jgi:hypothetical protein